MDWGNAEERVQQVKDWHESAKRHDDDWTRRALESYDFYHGVTWTSAEKAELEEKGAPALSINRTQPKVHVLSAIQRMNRYDTIIKAKNDPRFVEHARLFTHLIKSINTDSNQDFIEALAFLDGLICGRGYYGGDVTFDDNFYGDISSRYINPFLVRFDPTAIYPDLSDAMFMIESRFFTLDAIKMTWRLYGAKGRRKLEKIILKQGACEDDYFTSSDARFDMDHYRVDECWHKRILERLYIVNADTGDMKEIGGPQAYQRANAIVDSSNGQLFVISKFKPELWVTVVCGDVELFHGRSPFTSPIFPIFPFFCYHVGGRQDGIIEAMKDPQLETNKRRSQMLHIINKTANGAWLVDQDSLVKGPAWLKQHGNEPFVVIEKRPGMTVDRFPMGDFPVGLLHLENLSKSDFYDVSGYSPETMPSGSMGSAGSGKAISLRQRQGMTVLSLPMDNLRLTRRQYGRWQIATVQDFYTTERIFEIEGPGDTPQYGAINKRTADGIANDITIGKYKVAVVEEPLSPTSRMQMRDELMEMMHQGVPIPPQLLVSLSDVPYKDDIVKQITSYQEQMAQQGQGQGQPGSRGGVSKGNDNTGQQNVQRQSLPVGS